MRQEFGGRVRAGQRRATAWCGRLLLCAALLLGIVTMHTLGHPAEHGGGGGTASQTATASHTSHSMTAMPAMAPMAAEGHHAAPPRTDASVHGESHGMDPMSVCLAVLGSALLALVLLLGAAALRRAAAALPAVRARLLLALRPIPPPPRHKALARLSVLRV
ncbi:DUF6153 family protein [Streptomyces sp. NPDC051162]|uniref:DUF6153 family protein n=1 Tax=unclassified Streptomyces TaxID=2593676 RepID=UPI0034345384